MDEKQQIEKLANEIFLKKRLDWEIASVEENRPSHSWEIEVQVPDGHEMILSVPKGSLQEIKESLRQQTEEEIVRLKSH